MVLEELSRLPVGYLDDVMLFQNFAQAWATFKESKDQEELAKTHSLYEVCREIWYEQQGDRLKKARKKQP